MACGTVVALLPDRGDRYLSTGVFTTAAARALHEPGGYIGSVVAAQPVPSPVATGKGGLRR